MVFRHTYKNGVWVDLEQPTADDIHFVAKEFGLNERFEAELLSPTPTPHLTSDSNAIFLVLHFPSYGQADGTMESEEVDIIVGKRFILTTHYGPVPPLHELKRLVETQELVASSTLTTETMLEVLFAHFYSAVRDATHHHAQNLTRVEEAIFFHQDRSTIRLISDISREFLHMESALASHEELLEDFLRALGTRNFFAASFEERSERILRERTQVARLVSTYRAVTSELRETNSALLEARQNQIMKNLTVINFILLPLGLISWIFSMRTEGMPLIDHPNAFWIVLGMMVAVALGMTIYFARKKWL
jgi:magnesium transporter